MKSDFHGPQGMNLNDFLPPFCHKQLWLSFDLPHSDISATLMVFPIVSAELAVGC